MIITVVWYYILDAVICVATFFIVQKLYKKLPLINWEKTLPSMKDLPLVVSGKYIEDTGTIFKVTNDTIYIRGNERKEIVIGERSTKGFQEGDFVLVHYYPNMERGFVYQIEECE